MLCLQRCSRADTPVQQRRDKDEVGEHRLPVRRQKLPPAHPDAVHLATILWTEVEPPVERHDGSDLFGGCPCRRGKVSNIILNSLVVDVLTGYNHFPDLEVFAVHSQAMTGSAESSEEQ